MIECSHLLYNIKDKITVIISCYNEDDNIIDLLSDISNQYYSNNLNVIVVDHTNSNKIFRNVMLQKKNINTLNIELISFRNKNSYMNKTPYVFFIDPNIRLESRWTLFNYLIALKSKKKKYLSCKLKKKTKSNFSKVLDYLFPSDNKQQLAK